MSLRPIQPSMRLTFAIALVALAGCVHLDAPDPGKTITIFELNGCIRWVGDREIVVHGCPQTIGEWALDRDTDIQFSVPENTTGLELIVFPSLTSVGNATFHLAAGNFSGTLHYVGSLPDEASDALLEDYIGFGQPGYNQSVMVGVCHFRTATLQFRAQGRPHYRVQIQQYVAGEHDDVASAMFFPATCKSEWSHQSYEEKVFSLPPSQWAAPSIQDSQRKSGTPASG